MPKKPGVSEAYLDSVFSEFIRLNYADDDGYVICVTCGKRLFWKEATNGHFVKRGHRSLRWSVNNCHPQCELCNKADDSGKYRRCLVEIYGEEFVERLLQLKNMTVHITPGERKEMVDFYRGYIDKLKKAKGL